MKNIEDLRQEMMNLFDDLKKEDVGIEDAKIRVSVANTICKTAKDQMAYKKMTGSDGEIEFLRTPSK